MRISFGSRSLKKLLPAHEVINLLLRRQEQERLRSRIAHVLSQKPRDSPMEEMAVVAAVVQLLLVLALQLLLWLQERQNRQSLLL